MQLGGAFYGFNELFVNGLIDKMPKIIAIQAVNCSPLVEAFNNGDLSAQPKGIATLNKRALNFFLPLFVIK